MLDWVSSHEDWRGWPPWRRAARVTLEAGRGETVAVRAVVMVLRGRFRQHWKSWLALSVLVALAGGFVLATTVAARRTAAAFPEFTARHGYDVIVYSGQPLPQLARLPQVASAVPVPAVFTAPLRVLPQADRYRELPDQRGAAAAAAADGETALRTDAGPVKSRTRCWPPSRSPRTTACGSAR